MPLWTGSTLEPNFRSTTRTGRETQLTLEECSREGMPCALPALSTQLQSHLNIIHPCTQILPLLPTQTPCRLTASPPMAIVTIASSLDTSHRTALGPKSNPESCE